jgi:hypothetical protein
VRRTYRYAATTKDAAQRRRWTFYEAIKLDPLHYVREGKILFPHIDN